MKSFMSLFKSIALNRAAMKYARRLPTCLARGYGASEYYTPGQIEAAVRRAKLPLRHIALAWAMFLPQAECERLGVTGADYDSLRQKFLAKLPHKPTGGITPAQENSYATTGAGTTPGW